MYNIDKIDGLTPLTLSQMEETDGGLIFSLAAGVAIGFICGSAGSAY